MKNKIITIALLAVFVLGACTEAQPSQLPPTLIPSPTAALHAIPFVTYPPFNTPLTPVFTYVSPTSSPTVTATPTLDYAALGLPSPTATPTFDFEKLSEYYLTPFTPWPTRTGIPSLTPTANIPNMLASVAIRKTPPQPPPIKEVNYNAGPQNDSEWMPAYIQTVTDLMNYADGNQKLYLQYIESWVPTVLKYSPDDWFLEEDFDNDGQAEWLVSIPIRFAPDGIERCGFWVSHYGYCPRFFFIFEKIENNTTVLSIYML